MRFRFTNILILCTLFASPLSAYAEMNIFMKWLLFSDKGYAKEIEVKAYILTEKQSAELLANPSIEPVQLLASELADRSPKYLVVRVKNMGEKHAWGTLACSIPRVWNPIKIPIITMEENFCNYLISVDGIAVAFKDETYLPKITFEWDQLYTK
jgi:hypothetical protein